MTTTLRTVCIVAVLAFWAGAAVSATIATAEMRNPQDAVISSPQNHKVLFEDDHVRLLEVLVRPGETENMHLHQYATVSVLDAPQPSIQVETSDGQKIVFGDNYAPLNGGADTNTAQFLGDLDSHMKSGWQNGLPVVSVSPGERLIKDGGALYRTAFGIKCQAHTFASPPVSLLVRHWSAMPRRPQPADTL